MTSVRCTSPSLAAPVSTRYATSSVCAAPVIWLVTEAGRFVFFDHRVSVERRGIGGIGDGELATGEESGGSSHTLAGQPPAGCRRARAVFASRLHRVSGRTSRKRTASSIAEASVTKRSV